MNLNVCKNQLEAFLEKILSFPIVCSNHSDYIPDTLQTALKYTIFNGGKRLRPLLVYLTGLVFDTPLSKLHAPAAAVELIHGYSLVHDDLPAMDNDDYRRGKLSCHKAFGEATAILVGDALQTLAFDILANPSLNPNPPNVQLQMIQSLARAAGSTGMIAGQMMDMTVLNTDISLDTLINLHEKKTGALFKASLLLGLYASKPKNLNQYVNIFTTLGLKLGLLFQVLDDIQDAEKESPQKITFPHLLTLEATQNYAVLLYEQSLSLVDTLSIENENKTYFKELIGHFFRIPA